MTVFVFALMHTHTHTKPIDPRSSLLQGKYPVGVGPEVNAEFALFTVKVMTGERSIRDEDASRSSGGKGCLPALFAS